MSLSPNHGPRRHGGPPDMVVLHYTGMESCAAAVARLCDPVAEVSAHYVIDETGAVLPLVSEHRRAWHAGVGAWGDVDDVNSHSIGIELVNPGPASASPEFPASQMSALFALLDGILTRWSILPERVIAHSDMAPGRKHDPGPFFDWQALAARDLSVWTEAKPSTADAVRFAEAAHKFGYRAAPNETLNAFRLRFRPSATGPLDTMDTALMEALARRWPCLPLAPNTSG